jgi:hypothetical protein
VTFSSFHPRFRAAASAACQYRGLFALTSAARTATGAADGTSSFSSSSRFPFVSSS